MLGLFDLHSEMPTILSPKQWNAIVDYDSWNDPFTPDDAIGLHHGGGGDYAAHRTPYSQSKEVQQLQQWEGFHLYGRGWRGLAYGWAIGQTGTIYRIRGWNRYGAHTGDVDGDGIANNDEVIPVLFIGSGNHVSMSPAARASFEWLRENVLEAKAGHGLWLYGHTELKGTATSCPGPKLMTYVKENRESMTIEQLREVLRKEVPGIVWGATVGSGDKKQSLSTVVVEGRNAARAALAAARVDDTDEAEIATLILEGLSAEVIAKAIPEGIAEAVVDALHARTAPR